MGTFPYEISINIPELEHYQSFDLTIHNGLTTFIGPNGAGKSQVLRAIKDSFGLDAAPADKRVRYLTAGRLAPLENFRSRLSPYEGINYEQAQFGGKNHRNDRHNSEGIYGDIHTLNIRTDVRIKVEERLSTLFNRRLHIDWDEGNIKVSFSDLKGAPYSSAREASGLLHLVTILAALFDDEVGMLLIDEPEISLHPQLQSFLLNEIKRVAGDPLENGKKIVIIATHSTEFLDVMRPTDLCSFVFFSSTKELPIQIDPTEDVLKKGKIKELFIRMGQEHKSAFFSSRPLLVEGVSDLIICNALNRQLSLNIEASGVQIVPVIGKGEFQVVNKMLRLIGKNTLVLADLDSICDNSQFAAIFDNSPEALRETGQATFGRFSADVFSAFYKFVEDKWELIEPYASQHHYWEKRNENSLDQAKRRAGLVYLLNTDEEKLIETGLVPEDIILKNRLITLFDSLEKAGCFILRKGTIEDYFFNQELQDGKGKPYVAVIEVESLIDMDGDDVRKQYAAVIRALEFDSSNKTIDEGKAISTYLLKVIAPLVGRIKVLSSDEELRATARAISEEGDSLFHFSLIQQGPRPAIEVNLKSKILSSEGFPIIFREGCNVIEVTNDALNISY